MGGGLVDKRILYYDGFNEHKDKQKVTDIDLSAWDGGVGVVIGYVKKYSNTDVFIVEVAPSMYVDGKVVDEVSNTKKLAVLLSKQANGLWSITVQDYNYLNQPVATTDLRLMSVTGKRSATVANASYTEVSTMAVSDSQPISAGNLKAALDGLTGGGAPEI